MTIFFRKKIGGKKEMKMEITGKKTNPLLSRKEIKFRVTETGVTPSKKELRSKISAMANSKENLTVIVKVDKKFGESESTGTARAYESEEKMRGIEKKHVIERNFKEKKKKSEEEKPAEAKAGEGTEEKNSEEKKPETGEKKAEKKQGEGKKEEKEKAGAEEKKA